MSKNISKLFNRKLLAGVIVFLLLAAISVITYFVINSNKMEARVNIVQGSVMYKKFDQAEWQNLTEDKVFTSGDYLRTAPGGMGIVTLSDGSEIRLSADSVVKLTTLKPDTVVIELEYGTIYNRVTKNDKRTFTVIVENDELTALGTAFTVHKNRETKLVASKVIESKINFKYEGKDSVVEQGNYCEHEQGKELVVRQLQENDRKTEFLLWNREKDLQAKHNPGILGDIDGPVVTISEPQDNATVETSEVTVKGTTDADAKVYVNGAEVANNSGAFEKVVSLNKLTQTFEIKAIDPAGNTTVKTLTIKRNIALTLTGTPVSNGIKLNWAYDGITEHGFKVIRGNAENPVYPGNDFKYLSDANSREFIWEVRDGKTYHFRVCVYNVGSNSCVLYSNNVVVKAPNPPVVTGISLIGYALDGGKVKLNWTVNGLGIEHGFKVVWDCQETSSSVPSYPKGNGQEDWGFNYLNESSARSHIASDGFQAGSYYWFRVCQYDGNGHCLTYSNAIKVKIK